MTRQAASRFRGATKRVHSPGTWYLEWDWTNPPTSDPADYLAVCYLEQRTNPPLA